MSPELIFGNRFDRRNITNTRLANFAENCLNRFKNIAIEDQYATNISELTVALDNLRSELDEVDSSLSSRKAKTISVDEFIDNFKSTMSELEGLISFKAGGKTAEAYIAFYPHGLNEYSKATKTKMAELVTRVKTALTTHGTALGTDVTGRLGSFYTTWNTLRNAQETRMSDVSEGRAERTIARHNMELALHNAICTISMEYPFNVEQCCRFFDFSLLHPKHHHEKPAEAAN